MYAIHIRTPPFLIVAQSMGDNTSVHSQRILIFQKENKEFASSDWSLGVVEDVQNEGLNFIQLDALNLAEKTRVDDGEIKSPDER